MSRVALITGGGTGIGAACAESLAKDGFSIVLTGRREQPLNDIVRHLLAADYRARCFQADISDPEQVEALFSFITSHYGRLDLLFNNAGTGAPPVPIDELDVDHWRRVIDTNLTGSFLCARAAFRQMKRQEPQGGRIINNGSISAYSPRPNSAPYTASKHAITGLTRSLSLDGRAFNIACGQIDIGNAMTDMAAVMQKGVPQANGEIAAEPLMDVSAVAQAVSYMAGLPLEANVQFMTVMATAMPFVGRG